MQNAEKKVQKRNRKGTERAKSGMLLMNKHWLCLTLNERRSFSRKPNVKNYAKRAKKNKRIPKKEANGMAPICKHHVRHGKWNTKKILETG